MKSVEVNAVGKIFAVLLYFMATGKASHRSGCTTKICFSCSTTNAAADHEAWRPGAEKPTCGILLSQLTLLCSEAGLAFPGNSLENMLFVYSLPPVQLSQSWSS